MDSIGTKIRIAREAKGITQEQLGKLCRTTKQTIFKYENGIVTNIPMDRIPVIAKVLDVDPCYLMGWSDISSPSSCDRSPALTAEERLLVQKYRQLDARGKAAVQNVINYEYQSLPGENTNTIAKEA